MRCACRGLYAPTFLRCHCAADTQFCMSSSSDFSAPNKGIPYQGRKRAQQEGCARISCPQKYFLYRSRLLIASLSRPQFTNKGTTAIHIHRIRENGQAWKISETSQNQ
eukprot:1721358-Amphidinium_carterae.1